MEQFKIPPKLAMINDLTGYGRCSLAVAVPVVSALKVQACPVPTSVFSNHMAFHVWHSDDYTEHLPDYLSSWEKLSLQFDGILCGFMGNEKQAAILASFIKAQKETGSPVIILDPVMGDHGKLYASVTPAYSEAVKDLLAYADIITPNLTEACFLTETPYPDSLPGEAFLSALSDKLHAFGPTHIVITGLSENRLFHNFVSCKNPDFTEVCTFPAGGPSRPGTGDLFASVIAADALKNVPFLQSVKKAAEFVRICTEGSAALNVPVKEGVCFENYLGWLIGR